MDGRDLMEEIYSWSERTTLLEVIKNIPNFIVRVNNKLKYRVVNSKISNFYGKFHIGSIYDLKNFNNMLVSKYQP